MPYYRGRSCGRIAGRQIFPSWLVLWSSLAFILPRSVSTLHTLSRKLRSDRCPTAIKHHIRLFFHLSGFIVYRCKASFPSSVEHTP